LERIPTLSKLKIKLGQLIFKGELLTINPNIGGIGQLNRELSIQEYVRLKSIMLFVLWCALAQHVLIIKKKQFVKMQELEYCG